MNIMKKRISLVLGIIMLTLAIIPMFNVAAVEGTCQVSMTATMGDKTLVNNGKYTVHGGEKIVISAKSSVTGIKFISYYFSTLEKDNMENKASIYSDKIEITVPYEKEGTIIILSVEPVAENDNGKDNLITKTGWQNYALVYENTDLAVRNSELDIEPWMEENDETEELVVSLRNDSEEEGKANKNIYALDEIVTYYIDYKNGGKDIDDKVTVRLTLPLDFKVVDYNGGKLNEDDEIEWVFDGLEEDEAGTIIVKVKYTDLKKSRDDANTIYPSAEILKGKKVRDVSTVINYIITEYNEELDIEHDPYMYGDADSDTFRPDYIITRAEGALVLARIFGLDYQNVKTITTKYPDIGETYLEAQKAITAASEAGLINGHDDGTYKPNDQMTKAQFMTIIARMIQNSAAKEEIDGLQIKNLDKLVKKYEDSTKHYYANGKKVYDHWAIGEVSLLARLNMLPLNEENDEIKLDEAMTRAEVAQLINFYLLRAPADVTNKTKTGFSDVSRKHDLAGDIIEATRATHTFSITTEATEVEE